MYMYICICIYLFMYMYMYMYICMTNRSNMFCCSRMSGSHGTAPVLAIHSITVAGRLCLVVTRARDGSGGFLSHRATPSHHPLLGFSMKSTIQLWEKKTFMETPICVYV